MVPMRHSTKRYTYGHTWKLELTLLNICPHHTWRHLTDIIAISHASYPALFVAAAAADAAALTLLAVTAVTVALAALAAAAADAAAAPCKQSVMPVFPAATSHK
jgi:hypothetical protein